MDVAFLIDGEVGVALIDIRVQHPDFVTFAVRHDLLDLIHLGEIAAQVGGLEL